MNKVEILGTRETIYIEHLDNGLDIYVIPNNNISSYHVELVVKYGSYIEEFVPKENDNNQYYNNENLSCIIIDFTSNW